MDWVFKRPKIYCKLLNNPSLLKDLSLLYSDKDGKPDSWFVFDLQKRKRNPAKKFQEPVPEMLHISHQNV